MAKSVRTTPTFKLDAYAKKDVLTKLKQLCTELKLEENITDISIRAGRVYLTFSQEINARISIYDGSLDHCSLERPYSNAKWKSVSEGSMKACLTFIKEKILLSGGKGDC